MVTLKKSWKLIVAFCTVSTILARMREAWESILRMEIAAEAIAQPPVADTTEKELASATQVTTAADQGPPRALSMPIVNRWIHAEPQAYHSRFTPQDDTWWMGTPLVLRMPPTALRAEAA